MILLYAVFVVIFDCQKVVFARWHRNFGLRFVMISDFMHNRIIDLFSGEMFVLCDYLLLMKDVFFGYREIVIPRRKRVILSKTKMRN